MLALMVAAIMILAAVAKLGFIADLISKPTVIGLCERRQTWPRGALP